MASSRLIQGGSFTSNTGWHFQVRITQVYYFECNAGGQFHL